MAKQIKFSVITPVHVWNKIRQDQLFRCTTSVQNQTFTDAEHIIVDDGSTLPLRYKSKTIPVHVEKVEHLERINAYNKAFSLAQGEWFVLIDSDDEFFSYSLQAMSQMIKAFPEYKMFNFGSLHVNRNYKTTVRGAFSPAKKEVGHEVFGGGNIVNGTFIFHRSVYDNLGAFPPSVLKDVDCTELNYGNVRDLHMTSPWDFSAAFQVEFPEQRQFFHVTHPDHPKNVVKEIGNPWGNDHYLFYKFTRKYHSKVFDVPLIIIHHEGKVDGEEHEIN